MSCTIEIGNAELVEAEPGEEWCVMADCEMLSQHDAEADRGPCRDVYWPALRAALYLEFRYLPTTLRISEQLVKRVEVAAANSEYVDIKEWLNWLAKWMRIALEECPRPAVSVR